MIHRTRAAGPLDGAQTPRLRTNPGAGRRRNRLRALPRLVAWADAAARGAGPSLTQCRGYETAESTLQSCLVSAVDVSGAEGGFFLLSSEPGLLEVFLPRRISTREAMDVVLGRAAVAVQQALRRGQIAATDAQGRALPLQDGFHEANAPACLCVPMDLGRQGQGLLCLVRGLPARSLGELDCEIVQAVAEQAGLTLRALLAGQALARLEASLQEEPAAGLPALVH